METDPRAGSATGQTQTSFTVKPNGRLLPSPRLLAAPGVHPAAPAQAEFEMKNEPAQESQGAEPTTVSHHDSTPARVMVFTVQPKKIVRGTVAPVGRADGSRNGSSQWPLGPKEAS
jgi:hypothetical protein